MKLKKKLKDLSLAPIMGEFLNDENSVVLNLGDKNMAAAVAFRTSTAAAIMYMNEFFSKSKVEYAYGGYLENRGELYSRSIHFVDKLHGVRNIHLGMDIWGKEGKSVHAPLDGVIHSFGFNPGFGNYGPTLILQHEYEDLEFFTLYGHLSEQDMTFWKEGLALKAGQIIGHMGSPEENIGWPPHLHFQFILDIGEYQGDFPGVCLKQDKDDWAQVCPDPSLLIC